MGPDNGGPGWSADPHGFSVRTGVGAQRTLSWGTLTSPVLQDPELSTERLEPLDGAPVSRRKGKGAAYTLVINQKEKHPQHKQAFRVSCKGRGPCHCEGVTFSSPAACELTAPTGSHCCIVYEAISHLPLPLTTEKEERSCHSHLTEE